MPMTPSTWILDALRSSLKADGISYAELARRLDVSYASVKRWMSTGQFSLAQLDAILQASGIEWSRIAGAGRSEEHLIDRLSWEQEARLVADPELLLVALAAMNHLGVAEITAGYRLDEARCVHQLLTLDRMGFLELLPGNRIRMRVARTFAWIRGGPIERHFRSCVADFFDADTSGDESEALSVTSGMLSPASIAWLGERIRQLGQDVTRMHHRDAAVPYAEKSLFTVLAAGRPWEPASMRALRRPPATAARRIVPGQMPAPAGRATADDQNR